jgi:hypothetical protein
MSIAGHVSRAMLSRYSHVRIEAKRRALDDIAARQRAAEEKQRQADDRKHPLQIPKRPQFSTIRPASSTSRTSRTEYTAQHP